IIGNPSLNYRYRKGFYSLFKTLQQNPVKYVQKIMRLLGITSVTIKKFKHYTNSKVKGVFKNMLKSMMLSILKNATILMKFGKQIILC
ncbi:hypothetical protein, partial [Enterococcus faecium]|uniref:hypothetical protein n=1 Tax=Enterococcus faecium TaxID=1352 RepID=UPI0032E914C8